MTRKTMTSWIEIADERRFFEDTVVNRMPEPRERQHFHLGSAIFSLPGRIVEAFTHRHSDGDAR